MPTRTPAVYIIQDGETWVDISQKSGIAPSILQTANPDTSLFPGQQLRIPQPIPPRSPLPLALSLPVCHYTQPDTLICLGQVSNPLDRAVGRVSVEVTLLDVASETLNTQVVSVARQIIPAGDSAPYHALFVLDQQPAADAVRVSLISAEPAHLQRSVLRLTELGSGLRRGYYTVRLEVANEGRQTVSGARVIVTVLTDSGEVAGYRVAELTPLASGAARELLIEVPLAADPPGPLTHVVGVEAIN
jgi:hypothetical protein